MKEPALKNGAKRAWLVDDGGELDGAEMDGLDSRGISGGAPPPKYLVEELLAELARRYDNINKHRVIIAEESVNFKL